MQQGRITSRPKQASPAAAKTATAIAPPFPTEIRAIVLSGLVILGLLAAGVGAWGATAELASAVIAPAQVMVDSNRKTVRHLSGGIVREILVGNGDQVEPGQLMIRLDDTRAKAELAIVQQNLDLVRAIEARLLAEQAEAESIAVPEDLLARAHQPTVAKILANQSDLFAARRETLVGEFDVSDGRIAHTRDEIAGLRADIAAKQQEAELVVQELAVQKGLYAKQLTTISKVLKLERQKAGLDGRVNTLRAQIARASKAIGDAEMQSLQVRRDFRERVEMELRDTRAEIFDLQERMNAADFALDEMEILAPEAGIVVGREVHAPGAVVAPGGTLLELVPTQDDLVVEALVRPIDIDSLALGQTADIRFTAFAQRTTPILHGQVAYLAADVSEDPRSGEQHYVARIAVPEAEVARLGERQLQPGMPADVAINTGQRTVLDYLVQPLRDSLFKAWREE